MRSDFSGEYALNRQASTLSAAGASSVQSAGLQIQHDEPKFSCQGTFSFGNSEPINWAFELVIKQQPEAVEMNGATLHWDGEALVFTSRRESMTINFRYKFDAQGRLQLSEQLRGTDHDQDNIWIFDRC